MGLLLVARDYGGEPELIRRLSDFAGDDTHPDPRPIACLVLGE
jgi:hypothetical protein